MTISINTENFFNKIQHAFVIKHFQTRCRRNVLQHNTDQNPTANTILKVKNLKAFPKIRNKARKLTLATFYSL